MAKKMMVKDRTQIDSCVFVGPLAGIAQRFDSVLAQVQEQHPKVNIDLDDICIEAELYGYDGGEVFFLSFWREETETEQRTREAKEKRVQDAESKKMADKEAKELKELARLQKKYNSR